MTARKKPATTPADTVTVTIKPGVLVYHDGEQRGGVINDVPTTIAEHWTRNGWTHQT